MARLTPADAVRNVKERLNEEKERMTDEEYIDVLDVVLDRVGKGLLETKERVVFLREFVAAQADLLADVGDRIKEVELGMIEKNREHSQDP